MQCHFLRSQRCYLWCLNACISPSKATNRPRHVARTGKSGSSLTSDLRSTSTFRAGLMRSSGPTHSAHPLGSESAVRGLPEVLSSVVAPTDIACIRVSQQSLESRAPRAFPGVGVGGRRLPELPARQAARNTAVLGDSAVLSCRGGSKMFKR